MTPMLTITACAERIGCNEATIRAWIKAGTLPAARFGHMLRVDPEDFERFIAAMKARAVRRERKAD